MMIYKKSFSRSNKKSPSNLKRQHHKSLNKNTFKKSHQKNKKNKPASVLVSNHLSAGYILIVLFVTSVALIILYYKSILIYWQQAYHTDLLNSNNFIAQGTLPTQELEENNNNEPNIQQYLPIRKSTLLTPSINIFLPIFENESSELNAPYPEDEKQHNKIELVTKVDLKRDQLVNIQDSKISSNSDTHSDTIELNKAKLEPVLQDEPKNLNVEIELTNKSLPIVLTSNDKVFFAGDSLMQGVAPYVKKMLFKQYKIESLDLSKQSTGLAYPRAFDWSKTINDHLIADPSIKLLVVFLGANDPWDFPVKGYIKYAKFKSELWEDQYRLRIKSILNSAIEHNVQVLWLAAPCMRKAKLNDGMVYLNSLYKSEIEKARQHFLTTNELLGCTYEKFSNFVEIDKAKIKVRVDDGVHFTPTGQKILAKEIMEKIIYKELEGLHND
ncbi:DUF459 domain-containing protein [Gilliamella sp. Pra-s65]|uniref:SGNH/GDSL hydrolase family protein n=1 Tax=unclassified Gilliamella TaxID=2685620 RepID=UPI0013659B14|nr:MULTISPECIES: DUF459 domain-containing protein [unclassified Gilliamella]MWN89126.1 DUF459 domain-containing protein [Gilliamella sp. Pra-s65]MWP47184.1 DUF459 domain-containing protein [Gilliamella sp. Pas-s27]MWP72169.1 DUF459 domain-containing protein [Gilliamella sp. Pra-s52]